MDKPLVIARAYRGEPLKRVAMETGRGLVYVAAPEAIRAIGVGESYPVGFPAEDVFVFDSKAYEKLRSSWDQKKGIDRMIWSQLALRRFSAA